MDNLWQRRSNSSRLSLSTSTSNTTNKDNAKSDSSRPYSSTKRFGGEGSASSKTNPFNGISPLTPSSVASPTSGASSAFGLGSGAFASFGSSAKTPRTPGASLDLGNPTSIPSTTGEKREKESAKDNSGADIKEKGSASSLTSRSSSTISEHSLKSTWIVWYRPPTSKYSDYEKSTIPLAYFSSVEAFWTIYTHLKRPSTLPSVSDYHIFKKGVRPVWEDEENKRGGKWIVRLKKGVSDRYWEDLLLAIVGDQFAEAGEEVCGAVLSVRSGEDVLSVWTRIDGGRNIKIRETIKRLLAFPTDTNIVWKSHDDSIAQRSAIDQARHEKGTGTGPHHGPGKRRDQPTEESNAEKAKIPASAGHARTPTNFSTAHVWTIDDETVMDMMITEVDALAGPPERTSTRLQVTNPAGNEHLDPSFSPSNRSEESALQRRSDNSITEELRRLGDFRKDPDAIPIPSPAKRPGVPMPGNVFQGGFQPKNTLTTTSRASVSHAHSSATSYQNGRKRPALEFRTIVGDNVDSPSQPIDFRTGDGLVSKRQKLGPIIPSDPSELDQLSIDQYTMTRQRSPPKNSQPASVYSQGSGPKVTGIVYVGKLDEYTAVEAMMNSSGKKNKKSHAKIPQSRPPNLSTTYRIPVGSPSSELNPIDITADDALVESNRRNNKQPAYRGTARLPPGASSTPKYGSRTGRPQRNGERSKHFSDQAKIPQHADPIRVSSQSKANLLGGTTAREMRLAHQFRDSKGNLRSLDLGSLSSDELDTGTTVGVVSRGRPQEMSRPAGPSKALNSNLLVMTPAEDATGLMPSIIPPSKFTTSYRKGRDLTTYQTSYAEEKKATWSIRLAAINAGMLVRSETLGLVFNDTDETFAVKDGGTSLTNRYAIFQIQPKKLQKVLWANSGVKLRLESSKCETEDNKHQDNKIDIELYSEKDVVALLKELDQFGSFKTETKDIAWIDKAFEKRRIEQKRMPDFDGYDMSDQPEDIQLAARNKERRDEKKYGETSVARSRLKRPRKSLRMIDQLTGGSLQDQVMEPPQRQTQIDRIFDGSLRKHEASVSLGFSNMSEDNLTSLDTVLEKHQNLHQPLSQSRMETRAHFKELVQPSLMPYEYPEEERFSRKYGFGPPWAKPLTYPKTGKKKTTVDWSDLERLDEGEFLNDTLIGFYLHFLEHQVEEKAPELLKNVYFFNTFFFASLTNTRRGNKGINYESVQKWTRNVDLFSYDYVVVPINELAHWYVAIICNLPELVRCPATPDHEPVASLLLGPDISHTRSKTRLDLSMGLGSGPAASVKEAVTLVAESERPEEQVAATSFAEMSLEADPAKPIVEAQNDGSDAEKCEGPAPTSEDQELLDDQLKPNITDFATLQREQATEVSEHANMDDDELAIQDPTTKASNTKKRKRKSLPPVKTIDPSKPAIITFDSLGVAHSPTVRILKDYLHEEGKAKRGGMEWDDSRLKGHVAKQIPQQDNFSDCGLFLLGYMAKFLEDPKDFISKVALKQYDVKKDWPKMVPSEMRRSIRESIMALHDDQESERQRDRAEKAKKAGKYNPSKSDVGSLIEHSEKDEAKNQQRPSRTVANPQDSGGKQQDASKYATLVAVEIEERYPKSAQSTRVKALESASNNDKEDSQNPAAIPATTSSVAPIEKPQQTTTDPTPDPSPPLHDSSIIIIDSQTETFPNSNPNHLATLTKSIESLPSEIEDSQPFELAQGRWDGLLFSQSPPPLPKRPDERERETTESRSSRQKSFEPAIGHEIEELQSRLRTKPAERVRHSSVVELD